MTVRLEREGAIAKIVLARPERLNALDDDMKDQLVQHIQAIRHDFSVRAVVLTGEGRAFCAGSDVGSMIDFDPIAGRRRILLAHRFILGLADLDKPVIAAVRGVTVGVGWSLTFACDIVLASDGAKFGAVFKKIGLAPDGGAIYFLSQHIGVLRAKELVMSARLIAAEEALKLGLVTEVVPDAQLEARAMELAGELAESATFALGMGKRLFRKVYPSLESFLEFESHVQNEVLQSADYQEGVQAHLEKRPPKFTGR